MGHNQVSRLTQCPHFRGWTYNIKHTLRHFKMSLIQGCPTFQGCGLILEAGTRCYSVTCTCTGVIAMYTLICILNTVII